jgi:hypothetical protein
VISADDERRDLAVAQQVRVVISIHRLPLSVPG